MSHTTERTSLATNSYLVAKDGHRLFIWQWPEVGPLRAVLCHVHGFAEHSGCYDEFFSSLRQHGIRIISFDMRGHGVTREINENSYLLEAPYADIDDVLDYARKEAPMTPLFLVGHSMGGRFVLSYLRDAEKAARLSGALLIAPAICPGASFPAYKTTACKIAAMIVPRVYVVHGFESDNISRDPTITQKLDDDPYCLDSLPIGTLALALDEQAMVFPGEAPTISCPLIISQGSDDRVVCPKAIHEFFCSLQCDDKTLDIIPQGYHQIHRDLCKDQVVETHAKWILERATKRNHQ